MQTPAYGPVNALLVSTDSEFIEQVKSLWSEECFIWHVFNKAGDALEHLFSEPPGLLVSDMDLPDMQGPRLVELVKSENVYKQVPVVLCLERVDMVDWQQWKSIEVDDFIMRPFEPEEFRARVELTLDRITRSLDANPLTRLPGNTSIIHYIQDNIEKKRDFALGYVDLDNFKAFNDKYGFSRGDEALMMAARVVVNTIRSRPDPLSFVGHVGGDDFVFGLPVELAEDACKEIVRNFDAIVPHFYDDDDRIRGSIVSKNRKGETETFPLMAVSIAVVFNRNACLTHYAQASTIAMQLKKKAKEDIRSCYVIDRRA